MDWATVFRILAFVGIFVFGYGVGFGRGKSYIMEQLKKLDWIVYQNEDGDYLVGKLVKGVDE